MEQAAARVIEASHGSLRAGVLSPVETLAQSISTIAPTTTPTMTIPLVFALAGNGSWLSYIIATVAILLMALCINRFAGYQNCTGSLYTYVSSGLPPAASGVTAWALLFAYIATGASVAGGFINYANVFLIELTGHPAPNLLLGGGCLAVSTLVAYRDVQISARMMLWIEATSVTLIAVVCALLLWHQGPHADMAQVRLHAATFSGVRLGVIFAIFSFVGFESATALGAEAANPHRTIPRAVIQSAVFAGLFFVLCAYLETLGMRVAGKDLGQEPAPLRVLATLAGVRPLGPLIDLGALVSMFACTLACITAAARVLMRMAQNGMVHGRLGTAHRRNATPAMAVIATGALTALPVAALSLEHVAGADIYGWMGSLAVYGFLTAYGLAAIALPFYMRRNHQLTSTTVLLSAIATLAVSLVLAGTLYPVPPRPLNRLPYIYLAYIAAGSMWLFFAKRQNVRA